MAVEEASDGTDRGFRLTLPKVAETTRYKVVIDSAESRKHRLTAVEPPSVAKLVGEGRAARLHEARRVERQEPGPDRGVGRLDDPPDH